jgi:hypothetical protein
MLTAVLSGSIKSAGGELRNREPKERANADAAPIAVLILGIVFSF